MQNSDDKNSLPTPAMLAMLASGYDSGIILCCGEALDSYCLELSRAMPMTTKLVINVETDAGYIQSSNLPAHDIRIALHKQDHLSFLDDISRYFFNLVVIENNPNLSKMISGLLDKLMPSGMMMILSADLVTVKSCLPRTGWHTVDTKWSDQAIFIRAESADAQPKTRKGGRRARIKNSRV